MNKHAMNIIGKCAFNVDVGCFQEGEESRFLKEAQKMLSASIKSPSIMFMSKIVPAQNDFKPKKSPMIELFLLSMGILTMSIFFIPLFFSSISKRHFKIPKMDWLRDFRQRDERFLQEYSRRSPRSTESRSKSFSSRI